MGVISQHQITTFSVPVNGATPIDANTVRGNDNTIKTAYNAHDADTTIHVQNGAVGSRPAASIAGQMWLASDTGAVYAWLDTGSAWVEINYLRNTGGTVSGNVIISSGGITVTGNSTITGTLGVSAALSLTAAAAQIVGGATSLSLRNAANNADNVLVSDAGIVTVRAALTLAPAASTIIPGATSLSLRNNANNADNLIITDAGVSTFRSTVVTSASTTARAGFRLPLGVAPTSPVHGDMWTISTVLYVHLNGTTYSVDITP